MLNINFWVNNHAHVIKANLENNTLFLNYAFNIVNFNKYLVGGTRKKLNASSLSKIELKIPSLEEQEKIGKFFKNLDEKIKKEQDLLDKYKDMKKSLLQKMFI